MHALWCYKTLGIVCARLTPSLVALRPRFGVFGLFLCLWSSRVDLLDQSNSWCSASRCRIATVCRRPFLHASSTFPASCSLPRPACASKHIFFSYPVHIPSLLLGTTSCTAFTCCSPPVPLSCLLPATPASYTMHVLTNTISHGRITRITVAATAASLTLPNKLDLFCSPCARYPWVTS
jgi:hypothetical protein